MCWCMSSCDAGVACAWKDAGHFLLGACLLLLHSLGGGLLNGNWNAAAPKGAAANDDEGTARALTATAGLLPARVRLRCGQQFMCNQERRFALVQLRASILHCNVLCHAPGWRRHELSQKNRQAAKPLLCTDCSCLTHLTYAPSKGDPHAIDTAFRSYVAKALAWAGGALP